MEIVAEPVVIPEHSSVGWKSGVQFHPGKVRILWEKGTLSFPVVPVSPGLRAGQIAIPALPLPHGEPELVLSRGALLPNFPIVPVMPCSQSVPTSTMSNQKTSAISATPSPRPTLQ